jgi:rod shape-determining protein RodA
VHKNDSQLEWKLAYPWEPISNKSIWDKLHLDWQLIVCMLCVFCLSMLVLYSAKLEIAVIQKQAIRVVLAAVVMVIAAQLPPRFYSMLAPWLYFSTLFMLFAVLIFGDVSKGGQRWLDLKIIRFQPAELMKLAVPLMAARYLSYHVLPPRFINLIVPSIIILLPVALIALQPDLGTAILVASSGILVIFFAGISWRFIFTSCISLACLAPIFWSMLHNYQRQRIITMLSPESDRLGSGYQIIQSKIAIGSGGLYGKGWLNGTQSQLEFLPERTTDFIFAVFSEEFGFVGILTLLILYALLILRGLYIGMQAQDTFYRLIAGSLSMSLFVYVFVNIGMVSGILPVVGIPLPLVSYGGTSLVTILISFGIIMSIGTHRNLLSK